MNTDCQGELGNYQRIVNEYRSMIVGEASSFYCVNRTLGVDIDDLLQDVHIRIWEGLKDISQARNEGAYIRRLCRNTLINSLKSYKRHKRMNDEMLGNV